MLRFSDPAGRTPAPCDVAGERRQAIELRADAEPLRLRVGDAGPGALVFGAAPAIGSELQVDAWLDSRAASQHCRVQWTKQESASWKDCRIDIDGRVHDAFLTVQMRGALSAKVELPRIGERRSKGPVFLFLVDTLRADAVATVERIPGVPPGLGRLAQSSWVYTDAHSTSSWTRTAVASIFTGARAATHGVYGHEDVLGQSLLVLPELLQGHGFHTVAISANANVLPMWGFGRGFDTFVDIGATEWSSDKTDATALFDRLERELSTDRGVRGFYYVHFMDAHAPYEPEPEDRERVAAAPALSASFPGMAADGDAEARRLWIDYLAEVAGFERELSRFLVRLERRGLLRDSTIVVVGDHGEEFLDHGGLYHGHTLYEEQLHVPWLLKPPGEVASTQVATTVGLEDVAPTLATLLGIDAKWPDGGDVSPSRVRARPWRVAELRLDQHSLIAARRDAFKLILDDGRASEELYDLAADPRERDDLARRDTVRVQELRAIAAVDHGRGTPGWHFRFCGGDLETTSGFLLEGSTARPQPLSLETDDEIDRQGEDWRVKLRLRPEKRPGEFFGRIISKTVNDEDEIVVAEEAGAAPVLRSLSRYPLTIGFGRNTRLALEWQAKLTEHLDDALLKEGDLPTCGVVSNRSDNRIPHYPPYLRVWFVPSRSDPSASTPEIERRLRALGYLQ